MDDDTLWYEAPNLIDVADNKDWERADDVGDNKIGYDDHTALRRYYHEDLKDDWPRRVIVAWMLRAQPAPRGHVDELMLDVLRAPVDDEAGRDVIEWTKMAALAQIDERYDTFQIFYDDRDLLHRTVDEVLREHGMAVVPSSRPAASATNEPVPAEPVAALAHAVRYGDLGAAMALLDGGLDVDCPLRDPWLSNDDNERTMSPLMFAVLQCHRELADALIERGADVAADRGSDQTAVGLACSHGWLTTVEAMLDRGADVTGERGSAALIDTVRGYGGKRFLPIVERLVAAGAPLEPRSELMMWAVYHNRGDVTTYLLDHGVDVDTVCNDEWETPLHIACRQNHLDLVEMLVARGADVNRGTDLGHTPLMAAAERGFPRIVRRLLAAGAEPVTEHQLLNDDAKTAYDLAGGIRAAEVRELLHMY